MRSRVWFWRLPAVLAVVTLLLAACGGDDGGELSVGDDAPGFDLPDASGGTVSLDDYSDRPVLLYFHMAEG